jgi:methyl-accepting chemotaxis protein
VSAASFNSFVKKIGKTIYKINEISEQLANSSQQLSTITQKTEHDVQRQQTETTQVASAMEQMASTVNNVSRNALNGVRLASVLTSSATTAKPRPCSPARAASIAAFKANKLVCLMKRLIRSIA